MFKVNIVAVGKIKEKWFGAAAAAEYEKRLSRFCELKIHECKECSLENVAPEVALKKESADILARLKGRVIVLAPEGGQTSSEKFSEKLVKIKDLCGEATFVVGSSCGLDGAVKSAADELISFSEMTFPHTLFRVMLLEQLYRGFMISEGYKYHK